VTSDELRVLVESGTLTDLALVWQPEFGPEWRNVGQVRALFERPQPPPVGSANPTDVPLLGVTGGRPSAPAAAAEAFARMVDVLFRSFDIVRWLSLGFCAWLSTISISPPWNGVTQRAGTQPVSVKELTDTVLDQLVRRVEGPVSGWLAVAALWAVLGVWLCSLRSRGDFIFLHRWYRPDAPILASWRAARASGQALFIWRLGFYCAMGLLFIANGVYAYVTVARPYVQAGHLWDSALRQPAAVCGTVALLLALALVIVGHLAKAFVVPVMYWRGVSPSQAWLAVFDLCNQYPFSVLGYLCVGALCSLVASLAVFAFVIGTCCVGSLPLLLPYFNGVALLPVTLFFRGYAVCFLSRWRADLVPATV
jgi:type IV secretory pathway VirB2 component (pilin)